MSQNIENIKLTLSILPQQPGVYKYFDKNNTIIYIGKAKNLKKRVSSYFSKNHDNEKTRILVSKINRIEYTVVDSEFDALLLECNLIKQHQPKYNINLKDGKTYPLIKITNERFPRIFAMRNKQQDNDEYYGPYSSVKAMYVVLELVKKLYPMRSCTYPLTVQNVEKKKYKLCLEYQIKNCKGPCQGLIDEDEYLKNVTKIKNILKGKVNEVIQEILKEMNYWSSIFEFEKAQEYKEKLEALNNFQAKSTIVNHHIDQVWVFNISSNENNAYVNYLKVSDGMIISTQNTEVKKKFNESDHEILEQVVMYVLNDDKDNFKELILPFEFDFEGYKVTVPQLGDKKKLLDLSLKNCLFLKKEKQIAAENLDPQLKIDRLMNVMKTDLKLNALPYHIECFDNSNFQGSFPVSACVVFKNGKPSKKDYRHFNIKTVVGPNDFDSMKEVLRRRYSRLLEEKAELPNLIIVDGGKGQLSSAVEVLKELNLFDKIPVLGIAKKLEELFYPNDSIPLHLSKKSETLKIIQHMRDEAHRFGITHHRNRRSKGFSTSSLENIEGIGTQTADKLLKHFKSIKNLKLASIEELSEVVNLKTAQSISTYFKEKESEQA